MKKYIDIHDAKDVQKLFADEVIDIFDSTIRVYDGVKIEGAGRTLKGAGQGHGIEIIGSDVSIRNLKISSFFVGIWIEAHQDLENIEVADCVFEDIESEGVSTVIRESGCAIRNVRVLNNRFYAPCKERNGHCSTAINFMTGAFSDNEHPIHNVGLYDVVCANNLITRNPVDHNPFMLGITVHGNSAYAFYDNGDMLNAAYNDASHSYEENIRITDNVIDGVWDIAVDVLAGFPGIGYSSLKNVEIARNQITYHNTAINLGTSNIPCNGKVSDCFTSDVRIFDNVLTPNVPGPDEPQIGIMLFTIRAESRLINCQNCHMENIHVLHNTIRGREIGIALQAVHATQDLPYPSYLANCSLKKVEIRDNTITSAQLPVRIFTSHLEGRYDPFWGFELADFDESLPYSTLCEQALIDEVEITGNHFNTYDVAYTLGAAWGAGHSFIRYSKIGTNIRIENNELKSDHKVFCYERHVLSERLYDDATGSDNRVLCDFRK